MKHVLVIDAKNRTELLSLLDIKLGARACVRKGTYKVTVETFKPLEKLLATPKKKVVKKAAKKAAPKKKVVKRASKARKPKK